MKKLMVTIAATLFSLGVAANNPGKDPDNYCLKNRGGKTIVVHNGSELTRTIELEDGTRVKPNGTIVFTSGKRVKLVQGECVDENNLCHFSDRKGSLEEKMDANKERRKAKRESRKQKLVM
jgi:hypothetical protein